VSFSEWDRQCMTLALDEARRAATRGEVPVGAVLTRDHRVLANSGNAQIELHDPTAHAEIRVLRDAAVREGNTGCRVPRCMSAWSPARCVVVP